MSCDPEIVRILTILERSHRMQRSQLNRIEYLSRSLRRRRFPQNSPPEGRAGRAVLPPVRAIDDQ